MAPVAELTGLSEADLAVWRGFASMRRHLDRAVEVRLQHDAGVSTPEFEVLLALSRADRSRLRAGALADALCWEKSRISHQVSRMVARGLLERTECPTDARGTWVVLAEAGAAALAVATCGYVDVLRRTFFDVLRPDEKRALSDAAARVSAAGAEPDGSAASVAATG